MPTELHNRITTLGNLLTEQKLTLGTAESCTGGLIAAALTDISGSSAWFSGGIVSYANEVKENVLRVPRATLIDHGAVSSETVHAMMAGTCAVLSVDCAVAVSGIAGPTGGTAEKPVGTVWLAACTPYAHSIKKFLFTGTRDSVRQQTVRAAIEELVTLLTTNQ